MTCTAVSVTKGGLLTGAGLAIRILDCEHNAACSGFGIHRSRHAINLGIPHDIRARRIAEPLWLSKPHADRRPPQSAAMLPAQIWLPCPEPPKAARNAPMGNWAMISATAMPSPENSFCPLLTYCPTEISTDDSLTSNGALSSVRWRLSSAISRCCCKTFSSA